MADPYQFNTQLEHSDINAKEFPISVAEYPREPGGGGSNVPYVDSAFLSHDSNDYFFVSGIENSTFTAGRNSFRIKPSNWVREAITAKHIKIFDSNGVKLNVFDLIPPGSTEYRYTEGYSQVFGVLVYPSTPIGVGRIEISASVWEHEITGSSTLADDERWPDGWYSNEGLATPKNIIWAKAIYFNSSIPNKSDSRFFDFPELVASTEVHVVNDRYGCNSETTSGSCTSIAVTPKHGDNADYNYNIVDVKYIVNRLSGSLFNSAMEGASIRFTNIETVDATINVDFVAKISKVLTQDSILLDRPVVFSAQITSGNEDSPYIENTNTKVKLYEPFNETGLYSATALSSGAQLIQTQQVYNNGFLGIGHRKNYKVTNIKSANYEIVYLPRRMESVKLGPMYVDECVEFDKKVCLARLQLTKLRTLTGAADRYRVIKKSLSLPESPHCIAEGRLEPRELIYDWSAGEDFAWLGRFYNLTFSNIYWLQSGTLTYSTTPDVLIDSITISSDGSSNSSESDYLILKSNRGEPDRSGSYTPYSSSIYKPNVSTGSSWWSTDPKRYVNFAVEPRTEYSCANDMEYINSVEVVKTGMVYNSNFIKVTKNTMYELSLSYSRLVSTGTNYEFDIYFITTYGNVPTKIKLGVISNKTTRGFNFGTYTNKVFISRTSFGTIQLVPKFISSISISNISLKQFRDIAYSCDSAELVVPLNLKIKNERIELTVELFDSNGKLVYGSDSSAFGHNIALKPLRDVVIADPVGLTLKQSMLEVLTRNRVYYVRPNGSDSNSGLIDNASGSFRTIQRAVDVAVGTIDSATYNVIVKIETGSYYSSVIVSKPMAGAGNLILSGSYDPISGSVDGSGSTVINVDRYDAILAWNGKIGVDNIEFRGNSNYLHATRNGTITVYPHCIFSTTSERHMVADLRGIIDATPYVTYSISGSADAHWYASEWGTISIPSASIRLTSSLSLINFGTFCKVISSSVCVCDSNTFGGSSVTGQRYFIGDDSIIYASGSLSSSYLPGNQTGSISPSGQYIDT